MTMTPSIIKQVHKLSELDKMPYGLKITNRAGIVLIDSATVAGVDYNDELLNDESYDFEDEKEMNWMIMIMILMNMTIILMKMK